jgi:hypothetical protein
MKPPDSRNAKKSVTFSYFPGKNSWNTQSPKTRVKVPGQPKGTVQGIAMKILAQNLLPKLS